MQLMFYFYGVNLADLVICIHIFWLLIVFLRLSSFVFIIVISVNMLSNLRLLLLKHNTNTYMVSCILKITRNILEIDLPFFFLVYQTSRRSLIWRKLSYSASLKSLLVVFTSVHSMSFWSNIIYGLPDYIHLPSI